MIHGINIAILATQNCLSKGLCLQYVQCKWAFVDMGIISIGISLQVLGSVDSQCNSTNIQNSTDVF